ARELRAALDRAGHRIAGRVEGKHQPLPVIETGGVCRLVDLAIVGRDLIAPVAVEGSLRTANDSPGIAGEMLIAKTGVDHVASCGHAIRTRSYQRLVKAIERPAGALATRISRVRGTERVCAAAENRL